MRVCCRTFVVLGMLAAFAVLPAHAQGSGFVFVPSVQHRVSPAHLPRPAHVLIAETRPNPPASDPLAEYIMLRNDGDTAIDITGWTIRNEAHDTFTFPPLLLAGQTNVRVWTSSGVPTPTELYWNSPRPLWNDHEGWVYLADARGSQKHWLYYIW